jgi:hypothetical protein
MQEIHDMRAAIATKEWTHLNRCYRELKFVVEERFDFNPQIDALYSLESMLFQTISPTNYAAAEKLLDKLEEVIAKPDVIITKLKLSLDEAEYGIDTDGAHHKDEALGVIKKNLTEVISMMEKQ